VIKGERDRGKYAERPAAIEKPLLEDIGNHNLPIAGMELERQSNTSLGLSFLMSKTN